jgi:predicted ester cyclase
MSDDEHKRIVRRYYDEVFAQRNLAALDELFAPSFVGHSVAYRGANPPSRSEEGGTYTLADMRRDIAREHEAMPEDQTIVEEQIAEGDRVVTRWRYRWKHDQSLFGEAPTGQWLTMAGVQIDRLASGKIVERWEVKDFWGVVTHLGGKVVFSDSLPSAQSES